MTIISDIDYSSNLDRKIAGQVSFEPRKSFQEELEILINKHSIENLSNTPDYILAKFLISCLDNYNVTIYERQKHSPAPIGTN